MRKNGRVTPVGSVLGTWQDLSRYFGQAGRACGGHGSGSGRGGIAVADRAVAVRAGGAVRWMASRASRTADCTEDSEGCDCATAGPSVITTDPKRTTATPFANGLATVLCMPSSFFSRLPTWRPHTNVVSAA
jgi:hypothetical protein